MGGSALSPLTRRSVTGLPHAGAASRVAARVLHRLLFELHRELYRLARTHDRKYGGVARLVGPEFITKFLGVTNRLVVYRHDKVTGGVAVRVHIVRNRERDGERPSRGHREYDDRRLKEGTAARGWRVSPLKPGAGRGTPRHNTEHLHAYRPLFRSRVEYPQIGTPVLRRQHGGHVFA